MFWFLPKFEWKCVSIKSTLFPKSKRQFLYILCQLSVFLYFLNSEICMQPILIWKICHTDFWDLFLPNLTNILAAYFVTKRYLMFWVQSRDKLSNFALQTISKDSRKPSSRSRSWDLKHHLDLNKQDLPSKYKNAPNQFSLWL